MTRNDVAMELAPLFGHGDCCEYDLNCCCCCYDGLYEGLYEGPYEGPYEDLCCWVSRSTRAASILTHQPFYILAVTPLTNPYFEVKLYRR